MVFLICLAALRQDWYGTQANFTKYKEDFIKLYVDTIIGNVSVLDPSRQCISSSPTNGIRSMEEGWVAENPGDDRWGDIHHYDYNGDNWNWEIYTRRPRYASEYGYQSFPYIETLRGVKNIKDISFTEPKLHSF
jgi:beta-mannosidase